MKNKRGRPTIGDKKRVSITMRIDPDLLARVKSEADRLGCDYQSMIHGMIEFIINEVKIEKAKD